MPKSIGQLIKENESLARARRYAWAKYYSEIEQQLEGNIEQYNIVSKIDIDDIPLHIKNEYVAMVKELNKKISCPLCLEIIDPANLKLTNCGHKYCNDCFKKLEESGYNECSVCKKKLKF